MARTNKRKKKDFVLKQRSKNCNTCFHHIPKPKIMRSIFLSFVLLSFLSACGGGGSDSNQEDSASADTEAETGTEAKDPLKTWQLTSYGPKDAMKPVGEGIEVTLRMDLKEGKVSGLAACNNYFGSIKDDAEPYRFGQMGSTRKMCADEAVNQMETTFLSMLEKVQSMKIENNTLSLEVEGDQMLVFNPK
jgi:heat shock protein HslJ